MKSWSYCLIYLSVFVERISADPNPRGSGPSEISDRACNPYLGQVETIVMNESGSIVFQQDDYNDTMDSNMNGNRKLRARKVEAISFPIQNETEGLKVRECKCTDSYDRAFDTIGNFYCPLKYSSSCVIIHNETMAMYANCYKSDDTLELSRNAWPIILVWFVFLSCSCLCGVRAQMSRNYILSCLFRGHNDNVTRRLRTGEFTLSNAPRMLTCCLRPLDLFERRFVEFADRIWLREEIQRRRQQGMELEVRTKSFTFGDSVTTTESAEASPTLDSITSSDNESLEEPTCSICLLTIEEGDRIGALQCRHHFHVDCLKSWLSRKNTCPLCSQPVGKLREP